MEVPGRNVPVLGQRSRLARVKIQQPVQVAVVDPVQRGTRQRRGVAKGQGLPCRAGRWPGARAGPSQPRYRCAHDGRPGGRGWA
jgi:hypothetical protein